MQRTFEQKSKRAGKVVYELDKGLQVTIPEGLVQKTIEQAGDLKHEASAYLHANDRTLLELLSEHKVLPNRETRKDLERIKQRYELLKENDIPPIFKPEYESVKQWHDPETDVTHHTFPTVDVMINLFSRQWSAFEKRSNVSPASTPYILTFASHAHTEHAQLVEDDLVSRIDEWARFRDDESRNYVLGHSREVFRALEDDLQGVPKNPDQLPVRDEIATLNKPFWYAFVDSSKHDALVSEYVNAFGKEFTRSPSDKKRELVEQGEFRNITAILEHHTDKDLAYFERARAQDLFLEDPQSVTGSELDYVPKQLRKAYFTQLIYEQLPRLEEKASFQVKDFQRTFNRSFNSRQGKEIDSQLKHLVREESKNLPEDYVSNLKQSLHKQARYRSSLAKKRK